MRALMILALLGLAGCGGGEDKPEPEANLSPRQVAAIRDDAFLEVVRERVGERFAFADDDQVLEIGQGVCNVLDGGEAPAFVWKAIADGFSVGATPTADEYKDAAGFYGASTAAFCPKYNGSLEQ